MILKIDIKNFLVIICILFILKNNNINCTDCECTNNNEGNCKTFYTESGSLCLECSFQEGDKYYYLEGDNQCIVTKNKTVEGKVIYKTGENNYQIYRYTNCPNNFNLIGDFCFPVDYGNIVPQAEGSTLYKCHQYFNIENQDGFIFYNCLSDEINCTQNNNYNYNIHGEYECYPQCPEHNEFIIHGEYECYPQCPENNRYNVNGTYECYNQCPEHKEFKIHGEYVCYPQCPEHNEFKIHEEYECYPQCPENNKYNVNGTYECYNQCPENNEFNIHGEYVCYPKCPENNSYNVNGTYECYPHCPKSDPFYVNGTYKCYPQCPENISYYINGKYECLNDCRKDYGYTVNGSSVCINKCPSNYKYYENQTINEN